MLKLIGKFTSRSGSKILTFRSNVTGMRMLTYHSQTENNLCSICDICSTKIYNAIIHIENSSFNSRLHFHPECKKELMPEINLYLMEYFLEK